MLSYSPPTPKPSSSAFFCNQRGQSHQSTTDLLCLCSFSSTCSVLQLAKRRFLQRTHTYYQLWSLSSVSKQVVNRILVDNYQQHYPLLRLSDKAKSCKLSSMQQWPCCWWNCSCGLSFFHVMLSGSCPIKLGRHQGQVPSNWGSSLTLMSPFLLLLQCPQV